MISTDECRRCDFDQMSSPVSGGILTPLTLPDGNLNPKGPQLTSGPIYTPLVTVYESMIT